MVPSTTGDIFIGGILRYVDSETSGAAESPAAAPASAIAAIAFDALPIFAPFIFFAPFCMSLKSLTADIPQAWKP